MTVAACYFLPELSLEAAAELARQINGGLIITTRLAAAGIGSVVSDEIGRALRHASPYSNVGNSEDKLLEYGLPPRLARAIVDAIDMRRREAA